jgi:TIR domain/SIR2-like domain
VLPRVAEESVVPILGPDLLSIRDGGRETPLYPLLAARLAEALGVSLSGADLPKGLELQEVSRRHLARSNDVPEIYRNLRVVCRELEPIAVPKALVQLAKIPAFRLYVTTTFDVLVERAVDDERFEGQRQTLSFAYAPNDKQDLPPEFDRLRRPAVFHLMGRLSGTPHSYAVTREDALEFMHSLDSRAEDSPGFLFDRLRRSDLLIIGSRRAEWLARLFREGATGGRNFDAEAGTDGRSSPVLFVPRAGFEPEVLGSVDPIDFVDELYHRWSELQPLEEPEPPPSLLALSSSPGMPIGTVLLSSVEADRALAESIRDALDRAGIDVVLDVDDLGIADKWEMKLRSLVGECAVFVPLVSRGALGARRRFFRPEWVEAILEAGKAVPSGRFVLPVVLDDTPPGALAVPEAFGELPWERLQGGEPSPELVRTIVGLQRSYRSARFV